jgi:hypothetical protein
MFCRSITANRGRTRSGLTMDTSRIRRIPVGKQSLLTCTARLVRNKPDGNVPLPDDPPEEDDAEEQDVILAYFFIYLIFLSLLMRDSKAKNTRRTHR